MDDLTSKRPLHQQRVIRNLRTMRLKSPEASHRGRPSTESKINRSLISRINSGEVDIRDVIRYASANGFLTPTQAKEMETDQFRNWLNKNRDFKYEAT